MKEKTGFNAFSPTIFDFHDVRGFYFREGEPVIPEMTDEVKAYLDGVIAKTKTETEATARQDERNKLQQTKTAEQIEAERQKAIADGNLKTQLDLTVGEKDELAKKVKAFEDKEIAEADIKLREKVAKEAGIDIKHASRLVGTNEAEYLADAKKLAEEFTGGATRTNLESGTRNRISTKEQATNSARAHTNKLVKMI